MSTEELRKAVEALGKVLAFAGSENQADWQTILAALRDQEAEIARLRDALQSIAGNGWNRKEDYCHPEGCESPGIARNALTAHLGAEQ